MNQGEGASRISPLPDGVRKKPRPRLVTEFKTPLKVVAATPGDGLKLPVNAPVGVVTTTAPFFLRIAGAVTEMLALAPEEVGATTARPV